MRPLRSDRDVDLRPGQHQPLLHRRLHLRDAAQDVRPRQVVLVPITEKEELVPCYFLKACKYSSL